MRMKEREEYRAHLELISGCWNVIRVVLKDVAKEARVVPYEGFFSTVSAFKRTKFLNEVIYSSSTISSISNPSKNFSPFLAVFGTCGKWKK